MTIEQKQIIFELLRDNLSIYNELPQIEGGILCDDEELNNNIRNIIDVCYTIYMDSMKNEMSLYDVYLHFKCLFRMIALKRDTYDSYSFGFKILNSLYDKTSETFNELMNS